MTQRDEYGADVWRLREQDVPYSEIAERLGIPASSARRIWQQERDARGIPQARRIVGGMDEEPRPDPGELWARALRLQQRTQQVQASKERRRVIYDEGPVVVFFMSDLHLGSPGVDYAGIDRDIRAVCALDEAGIQVGVIVGGDLLDNHIVGKLQRIRLNSSPFLAIEEWGLVDYALTRLAPYIIGSVAGNHDNWSWAVSGVDLLRQRHMRLNNGILYDPYELNFALQVGGFECRVAVRHAWKGHSKYNPTHGIEDHQWTRGREFDIAAGGHTHRGALVREFDNGGKVGWAIMMGTYKVEDPYGKQLGLPPVLPTSAAAMVIDEDGVLFGTSNVDALARVL